MKRKVDILLMVMLLFGSMIFLCPIFGQIKEVEEDDRVYTRMSAEVKPPQQASGLVEDAPSPAAAAVQTVLPLLLEVPQPEKTAVPAAAPPSARPAIRRGHHGAAALQHHHGIPFLRIGACSFFPVGVDLCRRKPGQPGHLAGVRRDDELPCRVREGFPRRQQLRGGVQAVGVQHGAARKGRQKGLHQRARLRRAGRALSRPAEAGPQQQHRGLLALDARDALRRDAALGARDAGAQAALRRAGHGGGQHRFHAGQRHDARAGAQRTFHGQQRRPAVIGTARHRQHGAEGAFVAVAGAAREKISALSATRATTSSCRTASISRAARHPRRPWTR